MNEIQMSKNNNKSNNKGTAKVRKRTPAVPLIPKAGFTKVRRRLEYGGKAGA